MATQVQLRRGTTAENSTFTGAQGEVVVDTTKDTVVVHDGATAGGYALAREDGSNVQSFSVAGTLNVDSGTLFVDSANDRVGVGTTSPTEKLHVNEGNFRIFNSDFDGPTLRLESGGTVGAEEALGKIQFYANDPSTGGTGVKGEIKSVENDGGTGRRYGLSFSTSTTNSLHEVYYVSAFGRHEFKNSGGNEVAQINSNGDISFYEDTGTTPKFFWDASAERLGIGTSSPASDIEILQSASNPGVGGGLRVTATDGNVYPGIYLQDENGNSSQIRVFRGGLNRNGQLQIRSDDAVIFEPRNSEAMRIDSSGNLLVGLTNPTSFDIGCTLRADGVVKGSKESGTTAFFNRNGSDGDIIDFRKDGSQVGSIATENGNLQVLFSNAGFGIEGNNNSIVTTNAFGDLRDDRVDLGSSASRFKDLYLSGGVYLGGTGSANYLDDYEEGTWTPSLNSVTAGPTEGASPSYNGVYTKVGNMVHCRVYIDFGDTGSATTIDDRFIFTGLPFSADAGFTTGTSTAFQYASFGNGNNAFFNVSIAANDIIFYCIHVDGGPTYGNTIRAEFSYRTNA